jgi:hypothetical protein
VPPFARRGAWFVARHALARHDGDGEAIGLAWVAVLAARAALATE